MLKATNRLLVKWGFINLEVIVAIGAVAFGLVLVVLIASIGD